MISSVSDTLHRVIYLHIGLEKTGTTSIQKAMAEKREALHRESVLFPKSLGTKNNIRLLLYGLDEGLNRFLKSYPGYNMPDYPAFRAQLEKDFEREVEASGCKTIVISSEHLSSQLVSPRQIESVANFLRRVANDIRIVVYLRRQDHMAVSRYCSALKAGSTHGFSFDTEVKKFPKYYNFDVLLSEWAHVFGRDKLIVRWFDKGCFKDGDLLTDFADVVNLPLTLDPQVLNPSFDVVRLAWLKNFNANYEDLLPGKKNKARKNILEILENLGQMGPKIELSLADSKTFLDRFTTANRKVIAQYPPKGAKPNLSPSGDKAKFSLPEITIHDSDIINKFIVDELVLTVELQAQKYAAIREKLILECDQVRADVAMKKQQIQKYAAIREKLILERDKARAGVAMKEKTAKEFEAIREKLILERDKARAGVAMKEKTAKEFEAIREKLILERDKARADVAMKEKQIAKKAGQAKKFAAIREKLILERDQARADVAMKEKQIAKKAGQAKEFAAIREKLILERDQARADVAMKEKQIAKKRFRFVFSRRSYSD